MSDPTDDDGKVGYGRPPKKSRWKKGQSGNPSKKSRPRDTGIKATIDRLLLTPVKIKIGGETTSIPALGAIISQLWVKEMAGDKRALRTRLRYERFANRNGQSNVELVFSESEYTTALANGAKFEEHDRD